MKILIALVMLLTGVVYGQSPNHPPSAGPKYDTEGHLTAYVYPDGKSETYGYDSSWRMTKFVDRERKTTIFKYGAGGSMTVVNPDGSTAPR